MGVLTCRNLFRKRYGEIKDRFERKLLRFSHNQIEFHFLPVHKGWHRSLHTDDDDDDWAGWWCTRRAKNPPTLCWHVG